MLLLPLLLIAKLLRKNKYIYIVKAVKCPAEHSQALDTM